MSLGGSGESSEAPPGPFAAAGSAGRSGSGARRRVLFILAGVLVLLGSVAGFYLTSGAFDERSEVLVAATDIAPGTIVSALDFRSELADLGDIPHVPWTEDAPLAFDGLVAIEAIAAGSPVTAQSFSLPDTMLIGDRLEVVVQLDTSYSVTPVNQGDTVLLIDPGLEPTADNPGRPRQAMRSLELDDFDGTSMRLRVPPEEWLEWRALPEFLGANPQVLPVALGGDPEELAERLNAAWRDEWLVEVEAATPPPAPAIPEPPPPASPGPDQLEVRVTLDTVLAPAGLAEGDRVLLVDPGVVPEGGDPGRARSIIGELVLERFDESEVRLFVSPDEWTRWVALPEELGGAPMALPIPPGTDVEAMIERLDSLWLEEWEARVEALESAATAVALPKPGEFLVTLPLTVCLSSRPPDNGDQVFILEPSREVDGEGEGTWTAPSAFESRVLEGWDGEVLRFWAEPDRWAYYTFLPERLDVDPWVMVVSEPVDDDDVAALMRSVNGALARWYDGPSDC